VVFRDVTVASNNPVVVDVIPSVGSSPLALINGLQLLKQPPRVVESLVREMQLRSLFCWAQYWTWPTNCYGVPATNYPPDGFYGNLEQHPDIGKAVAQQAALDFYWLCQQFVAMPTNGQAAIGKYTTTNFNTGGLFDLNNMYDITPTITETNYEAVIQMLYGFVKQLTNTLNETHTRNWYASLTNSYYCYYQAVGDDSADCPTAKANASAAWDATNGWLSLDPNFSAGLLGIHEYTGGDDYTAAWTAAYFKQCWEMGDWDNSNITNAGTFNEITNHVFAGTNAVLFLCATNDVNGDGSHRPQGIIADGYFHPFQTNTINIVTKYNQENPNDPRGAFYSYWSPIPDPLAWNTGPHLGTGTNNTWITTSCSPLAYGWTLQQTALISTWQFIPPSD
jgi:hypothetical protein